ncbi:MAG: hypothetical protein A3E85_03605 [Gammaproteobacteria bacterium RIFCSPHIGHO2_12_FULL_45_12]|nr:MAG: hypothetical protein A3E85_03605 [Gammaproteobacteria bacterium RIFCSPHIGHO2_12_FULL_45_12]
MKLNVTLFVSFTLLSLTLAACAPFSPNNRHAGVCNEINSQMIFSGGTSNTRQSNIQNAEKPFLQRAYTKDNCER